MATKKASKKPRKKTVALGVEKWVSITVRFRDHESLNIVKDAASKKGMSMNSFIACAAVLGAAETLGMRSQVGEEPTVIGGFALPRR